MAGVRTISNSLTMVKAGEEAEDLVIGNIVSIGQITTETEEIDTTTLDSPNMAREFIQGAKDSGEFEIELNNVFDGTVEALNSVFDSGATRSWIITFTANDGATEEATLSFDAFIKARAYGEHTVEGLAKAILTLRISGSPTYAEGAS